MVTKSSFDIVQLQIDPAQINVYTSTLRKTLTDYRYILDNGTAADSLFSSAAQYFYNTFLKPVLGKVKKGQHLIIVPDRYLGHLPFEAFLTGELCNTGYYVIDSTCKYYK